MTKQWWVIHEDDLRHALRRVADGDDPDDVYADLLEHTVIEKVEP